MVLVETSARHVHVSQEALETLFGAQAVLSFKKALSQPGEFATFERVDVVGPKGVISGVSILGPVRKFTQVELSLTDARKIGIAAPVRLSGDLTGTPGCKLVGPAGEIDIDSGVVAAKRHIHFTPAEAESFGVSNNETVYVKIISPDRSLLFGDVTVRVHPNFSAALHIDTDESNAAGLQTETYAEIVRF